MTNNATGEKASISVVIRSSNGSGPVKAYADVTLHLDDGSVTLNGFAVIEKSGQKPWVGFPQKEGRVQGKYFPVVQADGAIEKAITDAVLAEYNKANKD